MAKILANSGQLVGHSGQVLNADAADCCCGGPPTGTCDPCTTVPYCSWLPYTGSLPPSLCSPNFQTVASQCVILTFESVASQELAPLLGRQFHCPGSFNNPAIVMEAYWRIRCDARHPNVQIGSSQFDIQFGFVAASDRSDIGGCPNETGCQPYTGIGSQISLRVVVTPMLTTTPYWCPAVVIPGQIAGPPETFLEVLTQPVNPCNIGTFVTEFATVSVQLASSADTGITPGFCSDDPPPPPPDPTGACCVGESCSERTEAQCQANNGTWYGAGSTCSDVTCGVPPDPLGACCLPNNLCMNMTGAQCQLHGGQWHPPPATCANTICQFGEGGRSQGLGDSLEKLLRRTGLGYLAKKVLGPNCGCNNRRNRLNARFPYRRR